MHRPLDCTILFSKPSPAELENGRLFGSAQTLKRKLVGIGALQRPPMQSPARISGNASDSRLDPRVSRSPRFTRVTFAQRGTKPA